MQKKKKLGLGSNGSNQIESNHLKLVDFLRDICQNIIKLNIYIIIDSTKILDRNRSNVDCANPSPTNYRFLPTFVQYC